jgi:PAS domain S-box-containing protein
VLERRIVHSRKGPAFRKVILLNYRAGIWSRPDLRLSDEIVAGWRGEEDRLWVITKSEKNWDLQVVSRGRAEKIRKNRILSGGFLNLCVEPGGVFWIATSNGLARYSPLLWSTPEAVSDNQGLFDAIAVDYRKRVWFMYVNALIQFKQGQWNRFPLPDNALRDIEWTSGVMKYLPKDPLLLGLFSGNLLMFNSDREKFETFPHPEGLAISALTLQKDSSALILSSRRPYARIDSFDGKTAKPVFESAQLLKIGLMRHMWRTDNGDIWVVAHMGVGRIRNGQLHMFSPQDGYPGQGAFVFREMVDGALWFGGRNKILEFKNEAWRTVLDSGLDAVRDICQSCDDSVWVVSGTGVHHYSNDQWLSNSSREGLPESTPMSVAEDATGRIWVGTRVGLRFYSPESDLFPPETLIQARNNLYVTPPGGEVRLFNEGVDRWQQTEPDQLLFSHRLDGKDWSAFSADTVYSFKGLPAGSHQFEVRAIDRNGNIDPSPAVFSFTVLLPWYRTSGFLVIASLGSLVIIFLVGYAVSRYVWLEKLVGERTRELKRREVPYRTLVENLQQSVYLKDREGKYVSANSSFCSRIGLSLDAILGKTDLDLYPADLAQKMRQDDRRVQDAKQISHSVEEWSLPQGTCWIESVKTPVPGPEGKIQGILGIFWDITERKRAEEDKRKMESQLLQMQKMEAVGRLAGGVAHDLNNMLTPILGYAQMLLIGLNKEDSYHDPLDEIVRAAERARDLVRQLLVFARKQTLEVKALDFNGIISGFEKMLRRTIQENVTIRIQLAPEPLNIMGDIHLLVTDVIMTGMNGKELAKKLTEARPALKVLYMSGYPSDVISHHSMLDETVNYIQKPFALTEFVAQIQGILSRPS